MSHNQLFHHKIYKNSIVTILPYKTSILIQATDYNISGDRKVYIQTVALKVCSTRIMSLLLLFLAG